MGVLDDKKLLTWKDDGISVPFERFQNFAVREGFLYVFTYPIGNIPKMAFALRSLDDLKKIEPFQDLSDFELIE
ncbi:hypothetical protein [Fluviicola sp.]|uniref:hypothetical protein n=1 Tax=Fluviicola sp. TaxID=1917219 RepID=UPI0031DAD0AB